MNPRGIDNFLSIRASCGFSAYGANQRFDKTAVSGGGSFKTEVLKDPPPADFSLKNLILRPSV
jgi:hypothetical protein